MEKKTNFFTRLADFVFPSEEEKTIRREKELERLRAETELQKARNQLNDLKSKRKNESAVGRMMDNNQKSDNERMFGGRYV